MKRIVLLGLVLALLVSLVPWETGTGRVEASGCKAVHVVKRGETLTRIAARYGVSMTDIIKANGIRNPNRIFVGQRLCIPGAPPPPPPTCSWQWINGAWVWVCGPKPPYWPPPPGPIPPPPPVPTPPPGCAITPILGFGKVWSERPHVRARLGCAQAPERGFAANDQPFVGGYVVQDLDGRVIYVMFKSGSWARYPDRWNPGDPINNPWLVPPPGYYQPEYGIGLMWRQEDNLAQKLGWALRPQQGVSASVQPFDGGTMIWTASAGVYVLYNDGKWERF